MGTRQGSRRSTLIALLTAVSALMLAAATTAQAVVVNFDDQPSATVLDEQYAALGVHFGPSPFPGQSGKLTAISRPGRARSAPNVAALAYDAGTDFSSSWIHFDKQQRKVGFYVCRTGGAGAPPQPNVNVDAYNAAGTMIDNQQGIQCKLNGALVQVTVETAGIAYISISATGGSAPPGPGWAIDDLDFETDPPPPPDADGDGVPDASDNCVDVANADQADADGDGIGSACDPDEPEDPVLPCSEAGPGPNLLGTPAADLLIGTASGETLSGLGGDDCIAGRDGSDRLAGGEDDDSLYGESGNDSLGGGSGSDRLSGGAGRDRLDGDSSSDRIVGGSGSDRIVGGSGSDRIVAGSGSDRISARDRRRDQIDCGSGRDRVTADRIDRVSRDCERVQRR